MFKIQTDKEKVSKSVANLLPCRIHHNGPVEIAEPFWKPTKADGESTNRRFIIAQSLTFSPDGKQTAFFRGRQLYGKSVKLPEGYRGVVVEKAAERADAPNHVVTEIDDDEVREVKPQPRSMVVKGEFDEMVVWGHETIADASSDAHVRSMEEWLQVSSQIHSYEPPASTSN